MPFFTDNHAEQHPGRHVAARRSTLVSVGVNLVLTLVQISAGLWSRSQGLIADGIHSLSDLVADFVVLFANHHSQKAPDAEHPYGHQRFENGASLVLGLLLMLVGAGMLNSAFQKLEAPDSIAQVHRVALWVALGALVAKETLFRYLLTIAKQVRSSMLVANAWHARSDAASSLVVAVGIGGNLLGVRLLDPIAALIVGCMVGRMGWSFMWDALHVLMDRGVSVEQVEEIRQLLLQTAGIRGLHELRTRKMGDMVLVDVHLEVDADITVEAGHEIVEAARARVMQELHVLDVMTHVDPVRVR